MIDFLQKRYMIKRQCQYIRDQQKKVDQKRQSRIRNYAEYESRPEVKAMRQKWKEENIEKCRGYWQKYRERKKSEDLTAYLAHNAEVMRLYRKNHPEYFTKVYDDAKKILNANSVVIKKEHSKII